MDCLQLPCKSFMNTSFALLSFLLRVWSFASTFAGNMSALTFKQNANDRPAKSDNCLSGQLSLLPVCKDRCEASQGVQPLVRSSATQRMTVWTGIQAPQDALRGNLVTPYRSAPLVRQGISRLPSSRNLPRPIAYHFCARKSSHRKKR